VQCDPDERLKLAWEAKGQLNALAMKLEHDRLKSTDEAIDAFIRYLSSLAHNQKTHRGER